VYVKGKLTDEYKQKTESAISDKSETALKTADKFKSKAKPFKRSGKQPETRECFFCKKVGHLKKDCKVGKRK